MDEGRRRLRDRMLRHAILEVLGDVSDPSDEGTAIPLIDLVRDVTVDGDSARVELELTSTSRPFAGPLVAEVQRRLQSLPEVVRFAVEVSTRETEPEYRANS